MTVMPEHTARFAETTRLVVLDPNVGPVSRPIAALALGDEVLVVAGGRMCFRRVMAAEEAPAPARIVDLPANALAPDMPRHAIALDASQKIGLPSLQAPLFAAEPKARVAGEADGAFWVDLMVEGAERIVAENICVATGPLTETTDISEPVNEMPSAVTLANGNLEPSRQTNHSQASQDSSPEDETISLRAFNGPAELPLATLASEGVFQIYRFTLPPRTTTLRLSSPSAQPPGDGRRLGVAIFRLMVEASDIPLDSPNLVRGFHRAETGQGATWRWTDGEALLILPPKPAPQTLSVQISNWHALLPAG